MLSRNESAATGTTAVSLRHCTAPYGTIVRSRVYERAAGARWCWSAMGAARGEISLRARVHGSRENREPPARQKRHQGTRGDTRPPRDNSRKTPASP